MGIHYQQYGKKIIIEQTYSHPLIYLDNWAINDFTEEKEYHDKFICLIKKLEGTLAISRENILEIGNLDNTEKREKISKFIDSVDCVYIDTNIERVKSKLKKINLSIPVIKPWYGMELLHMHNSFCQK